LKIYKKFVKDTPGLENKKGFFDPLPLSMVKAGIEGKSGHLGNEGIVV
jgi:hypothetical protein